MKALLGVEPTTHKFSGNYTLAIGFQDYSWVTPSGVLGLTPSSSQETICNASD